MPKVPAPPDEERRGFFLAAFVYVFWGITPIYWRLLNSIPAPDVIVQRVFWSAVFIALVTMVRGHFVRAFRLVRERRTLGILVATGLLISFNWGIYIYCVESGQLVEASLGYYMTPLVSFALGFVFFGERLSRLRWIALGLATAALAYQISVLGHFPWISPGLAISFGLYGYFRKRAQIPAMDGLLVETSMLLPFAVAFMIYRASLGETPLLGHGLTTNLILIGTGPLTAIPLAMFAAGAKRVSMATLGFLQYLTPSITLLLAVFAFGEAFSRADMVAFGCVWAALAIVALEGRGSRLFARFSGPKP
ncbi:MAG: EamA family transporter RarD [Rhodospirillaceae bacterium]|nr:EamA family transporter RarD [Rhodospirillaceae bacterium]